jgi:CheY-like chemotaxis protein
MSLARDNYEATDRYSHGVRVLVVDDNDDVADCLAMLLQRLGHLSRACCSGRDCLACLHEFRPDVILLDLSMPVQDGFEICRLIRQTSGFEDIPVIACSAFDPYLMQDRAVGCDFADYLVKPVSSRQLQAAIENVLAEPSVRADL